MKQLKTQIQGDKDDSVLEFQSIGWKRPPQDGRRRQLYALDEDDRNVIISLAPAVPDWYSPGIPFAFTADPFPQDVCVEIVPCRLLPPPCWNNRAQYDLQAPALSTFSPWAAEYIKTHGEALMLEPGDDADLQCELDAWKDSMRMQFESELESWQRRLDELNSGDHPSLRLKSKEDRLQLIGNVERQISLLNSDEQIEGIPCLAWQNLTLEEVRDGFGGIRDDWMQSEWAHNSGLEIQKMERDRTAFRKWLVDHTGTPTAAHDSSRTRSEIGIKSVRHADLTVQHPQFLVACARVRFRARFADNSVVFLSAANQRDELSEFELGEAERMLKNLTKQATTTATDKAESVFQMKHVGEKRWSVHFGENEPFIVRDSGFARELLVALSSPHTELHVLQLQNLLAAPITDVTKNEIGEALNENLFPQTGPGVIQQGRLSNQDFARALAALKDKETEARAAGRQEDLNEAEDLIAKLKKYQARSFHPEGDAAKRENDRARKALKRFKESLKKNRSAGASAFLLHLEKYLSFSRQKICYRPQGAIRWKR